MLLRLPQGEEAARQGVRLLALTNGLIDIPCLGLAIFFHPSKVGGSNEITPTLSLPSQIAPMGVTIPYSHAPTTL